MAKILCALYGDPINGYPKESLRDDIPTVTHYANGQTAPTPHHVDFVPGELLGSVTGELGLRHYPGGTRPYLGRHVRQGRRRLGVRT